MTMKKKVILLFSGGLDSVIAALMLKEQDIEVTGLYIENGFRNKNELKVQYLKEITNKIGIPLIIKNKEESFFEMWKNPKYGYGKAMNPCVNCHASMLNVALDYVRNGDYDFVATGEVAEQRGFSQTFVQQKKVDKIVGTDMKLVLRPLSAKKWKETEMEKLGWVDREKMLSIVGKSRKIQYQLLSEFGFKPNDVEVPAGGCILAEKSMKKKMKGIDIKELSFDDFQLMKTGRHLDILSNRLVLTRDKNEMILLDGIKSNAKVIKTNQVKSPVGYFFGEIDTVNLIEISKTMLKYTKVEEGDFEIEVK